MYLVRTGIKVGELVYCALCAKHVGYSHLNSSAHLKKMAESADLDMLAGPVLGVRTLTRKKQSQCAREMACR